MAEFTEENCCSRESANIYVFVVASVAIESIAVRSAEVKVRSFGICLEWLQRPFAVATVDVCCSHISLRYSAACSLEVQMSLLHFLLSYRLQYLAHVFLAWCLRLIRCLISCGSSWRGLSSLFLHVVLLPLPDLRRNLFWH